MVTVEPDLSRLNLVAERYNKGESQAQISRDLKISRERIRQILRKQCPRYNVKVLTHAEWHELRFGGSEEEA